MRLGALVLVAASCVSACDSAAPHDQPWAPAARALLQQVRDDGYEDWQQIAIEGDAPHGAWSIVHANAALVDAEAGPEIDRWPDDVVVVCEGRDEADGPTETIQIMTRGGGGWTWAQYGGDDEPWLYGREAACSHCHAAGEDFLRTFALPEG